MRFLRSKPLPWVLAGTAGCIAIAAWWAFETAGKGSLGPDPADVLVVFGSPVDYTGAPMPMQLWRVDEAVAEYRRGQAPYLLFTGGAAANRFVESETMAREAIRRGVPASAVLRESRSTTTIENLRNVEPVLKAHGWTRVEIVSSADHLPRIAVLLRNAPFQWRLHAAPTPGRSLFNRVSAYVEESLAILALRVFGSAAEPVIHAVATALGRTAFAFRYIWYSTQRLLHR